MSPNQRRIVASIDQWHVPPEHQGQIVERAYGVDWESGTMVCRITDRSDRSVVYSFASAPEVFEPWNEAPRARNWTEARV